MPRNPVALSTRLWMRFCRAVVRVFYRYVEIDGGETLPRDGATLVCANHNNAFVDAVLLQSAASRILHPLARSGLFQNVLLRPILRAIQAVPIYRPQDPGSDTRENRGSFDRCFELLARGEALLVFPEGVSHSKPSLRPLKTGAARIVLGSALRGGPLPTVVPAGLTFIDKGRFRSRALVQIGEPLCLDELAARLPPAGEGGGEDEPPADLVHALTERIDEAIRKLTLNVDAWQDLVLLRQLERFFHFRRGRHPRSHNLRRRFRTVRKLLEVYRRLSVAAPHELDQLRRKLLWFERVRRLYGIEDYHLRPPRRGRAAGWMARRIALALLLLPSALVGFLTSGPAYLFVSWTAPRVAERYDQYDTNKIILGLLSGAALWGGLIGLAFWRYGALLAFATAAALPLCFAAALAFSALARRIAEATRIFVLFHRKPNLRAELLTRRHEIERDLAALAQRSRTAAAGARASAVVVASEAG